HNSLQPTRPLVLVMFGDSWNEMPESRELRCEDPMLRWQEMLLRRALVQDAIGDDTIFEPWLEEWASYVFPPLGRWGVECKTIPATEAGGAFHMEPSLKELGDFEKLVAPRHVIDEARTAGRLGRLREAVGDVIAVKEIRAPYFRSFRGDISTDLGGLRGIDQLMLDMVDNPEWLHRLLAFMRDAILAAHDDAEAAGDWRLTDHVNQSMPYAQELPDPGAHDRPVTRRDLWGYMAAQELTLVSPAMHEEFMFQYQRPILEKFGLVSYGCCEDLTRKIGMLRQLPNLRRIAVTPFADVQKCAEQIGTDYVISWRPNPALMVCCGWDEARVRRVIREGLAACRGLHVDITLKDVQTVEREPRRLQDWVRIVREESGSI
ncbi:MAG: hypothetical protein WCI17_11995, partial [bacterium]